MRHVVNVFFLGFYKRSLELRWMNDMGWDGIGWNECLLDWMGLNKSNLIKLKMNENFVI